MTLDCELRQEYLPLTGVSEVTSMLTQPQCHIGADTHEGHVYISEVTVTLWAESRRYCQLLLRGSKLTRK